MKKMMIGFILIFVMANTALANGACSNCTIKSIGVGPHYDANCTRPTCVFIMVQGGTYNNIPSCVRVNDWHFVVDTSTESGRVSLSVLLTAFAANKPINISGNGICSLYGESEDFLFAFFTY